MCCLPTASGGAVANAVGQRGGASNAEGADSLPVRLLHFRPGILPLVYPGLSVPLSARAAVPVIRGGLCNLRYCGLFTGAIRGVKPRVRKQ